MRSPGKTLEDEDAWPLCVSIQVFPRHRYSRSSYRLRNASTVHMETPDEAEAKASALPGFHTRWLVRVFPFSSVSSISNYALYLPILFCSAAVSSVLRLWAFVTRKYNSPDMTYTTANPAILYCVEASIAITSACLPSLKPFFIAVRSTYRTLIRQSSPSLTSLSSGSPSQR